MQEPVLAALDLNKKTRMEVDASNYAMGGILSMEGEDGFVEASNIPLKIFK